MTQQGPAIPILRPRAHTVKQYELKLHDFNPFAMDPLGDRYIVEGLAVEETVMFGSFLVVSKDAQINPKDPSADPTVERRGALPAVIIAVGNGHLLGLPDPRIVVRNIAGQDEVERHAADVPLFCRPGDVVLIDMNNRGRNLKIVNREIRVINQIDVLVKLPKRLTWTDEGWVEEVKVDAE